MQIKPHPALPNVVCSACICRLNFHFEFQNRAQRNIDNLRLEYYARANNQKMVRRLTKMKRIQNNASFEKYRETMNQGDAINAGDLFESFETNDQDEHNVVSSGLVGNKNSDDCSFINLSNGSTSINIDKNDFSTTSTASPPSSNSRLSPPSPITIQNNAQNDIASDQTTYYPSNQSQNENQLITSSPLNPNERIRESLDESGLLEPMFQMSENLCDTESGGNIHTENELNAAQLPSRCMYCPKIYYRPHNLARHTRKHLKLIRTLNKKKPAEEKIFTCDVDNCNENFTTLKAIRKHYKTHCKKFICPGCSKEFVNWNDMTWHIIVCKATKTNGTIERRTRSRNKKDSAATSSLSDNETDSELSDTITISSAGTSTIYNERLRRIENKANHLENNTDTESDLSDLSSVMSSTDLTLSERSWSSNTARSTTNRRRKLRKGKKKNTKLIEKPCRVAFIKILFIFR